MSQKIFRYAFVVIPPFQRVPRILREHLKLYLPELIIIIHVAYSRGFLYLHFALLTFLSPANLHCQYEPRYVKLDYLELLAISNIGFALVISVIPMSYLELVFVSFSVRKGFFCMLNITVNRQSTYRTLFECTCPLS